MDDCDEDVLFEGSALHQHLVSSGYESELEIFHKIPDKIDTRLENDSCPPQQANPSKSFTNIVDRQLGINYESLVVEVAHQAIDSKLLVDEDVDFLKHFLRLEEKAKNDGLPWFVPATLLPLAFLSSSSSSAGRMLGLTGFALFGVFTCLRMKHVYLQRRIVSSHSNLLESSKRLKCILNEARLLYEYYVNGNLLFLYPSHVLNISTTRRLISRV